MECVHRVDSMFANFTLLLYALHAIGLDRLLLGELLEQLVFVLTELVEPVVDLALVLFVEFELALDLVLLPFQVADLVGKRLDFLRSVLLQSRSRVHVNALIHLVCCGKQGAGLLRWGEDITALRLVALSDLG